MKLENRSDLFESKIYRKAITELGDVIAIMDDKYNYLFASKTMADYMGLKKTDVVKRNALEVIGEELFTRVLKPYIDKSLQGKRTTFEMELPHTRFGDRFFHLKCYPIVEKGTKTVMVVARDITPLKQREQSMLRDQKIYHVILDKITDIFLIIDPNGIILTSCKYIDRQTGLSSKSVIGQSLERILTPDSMEVVKRHLQAWNNRRMHSVTWEAEVIGRQGKIVPFEVRSTPVYEKGSFKWIIVVARNLMNRVYMKDKSKNTYRDIEKKLRAQARQSEEKLQSIKKHFQQLSSRLLEDQERERNAIGRELHDEVGGFLTLLGIYLSKMTKEPENKAWLEQFTQSLNDMVQYVRSLSHSLYPILLERGELLAALISYFESYQKRTGIKIDFIYRRLDERLPSHIEVIVYRIIQEALTNVAKHASADNVKVSIVKFKKIIKLSVEDNGHGFDISKVIPARSYGISGMKNRAMFAGGKLEVNSTPGQGTIVSATLPVIEIKKPDYQSISPEA